MRARAITQSLRAPEPPAVLVGRHEQLGRLREVLRDLPIAVVLGLPGVGKSALAYAYAASYDGPVLYTALAGHAAYAALLDRARASLGNDRLEPARTDDDRLTDLARRIEAARALWLLDDLAELPPG